MGARLDASPHQFTGRCRSSCRFPVVVVVVVVLPEPPSIPRGNQRVTVYSGGKTSEGRKKKERLRKKGKL